MRKTFLIFFLTLFCAVSGYGRTAQLNPVPADTNGNRGAVLVGNNGNKVNVQSNGSVDVNATGVTSSSPAAKSTVYQGEDWNMVSSSPAAKVTAYQDQPYASRLVDSSGNNLTTDAITNTLVTISLIHNEVHEGEMFESSYIWDSVADDSSGTITMFTGANDAHMVFAAASGGDAYMYFQAGISVISSGTALTAYNMKRDAATTATTEVYRDAVGIQPAMVLSEVYSPGGTGTGPQGTAVGGTLRGNTEWILKANAAYTFVVVNKAGSAKPASISLQWYEE